MDFSVLAKAVCKKIDSMSRGALYKVDVGDRNTLWQLYLSSFPPGTNPIYKTNTEHDCNCCKNFIRDIGGAVVIKDSGELETIWDIKVGGYYQEVVDALAAYVKGRPVASLFSAPMAKLGVQTTYKQLEDGTVVSWDHFYCLLADRYVRIAPSLLSEVRSTVDVFKRGLEEISVDTVNTVLDLIASKTLYRGEEFKEGLQSFRALKQQYNRGVADSFFWQRYKERGARIRNTVIGTLLQDLSVEDYDLEGAVRSYEQKVAPTNYKRPTALITKRMVEDAMKTVKDLDIESSFSRRFATPEDLSINNVLFADRGTAVVMKGGLLTSLLGEVKETGKYDNATEMLVEEFIETILPKTQTMELFLENRHVANLVSLIAPKDDGAPPLFRWNNRFSWSYRGNVTDSIKERVKKAGGNIDAELRFSLAWFNHDDLDLHVMEPGHHIYFGAKQSIFTQGFLDVDMNVHATTREPVENVAWGKLNKLKKGTYNVYVHNYNKREHTNVGFEIEMELMGEATLYSYAKAVSHHEKIDVASFEYDGKSVTNVVFNTDLVSSGRQQEVWGIKTGQFHKVSLLTISPNHWDDNKAGNKHYLFMLENCINDERPRGFYNEFLRPELEKHRKVFEVLGDKTKCESSDRQLSGVGFSSTKTDVIVCKCNNRVYKVVF